MVFFDGESGQNPLTAGGPANKTGTLGNGGLTSNLTDRRPSELRTELRPSKLQRELEFRELSELQSELERLDLSELRRNRNCKPTIARQCDYGLSTTF